MSEKNHAGYLNCLFDKKDMSKAIDKMKDALEPKLHLFDGFVVTGLSGIGMGFILAKELGKKVVVIRKGEDCHSGWEIENLDRKNRLVFLDDFVANGHTIKRIYNKIEAAAKLYSTVDAKIVGSIFYDPFSFHWGYAAVKKIIEFHTPVEYQPTFIKQFSPK